MIPDHERLIIVLGMAHSGTTIITQTLAQHPDVVLGANGGESWLLENDWLPNEDSAAIAKMLDDNPGRRLLLKRPWNECHHAEWMACEIPFAMFIYCQRECSEIRKSWSKPTSQVDPLLRDPTQQRRIYDESLQASRDFENAVPDFFRISHEALLADPAGEIARLAGWLGLDSQADFTFDTSAIGTTNIKHRLLPEIASGRYTLGSRGNGFTWAVDPNVPHSGLDLRNHEDWIYRYTETPADGVFVDVGAFVGTHAIRVAKECGCRVIAFEPVPAHVAIMRVNAVLNEAGIQIIEKAVGDTAGRISYRFDGPAESRVRDNEPARSNAEVEITTLDHELSALDRLDTLLIDTEGFEVHVLRGGVETIRRCRPRIIIEVHSHYAGFENNGNLIDEWCRGNGYTSRRIWENTNAYYYVELTASGGRESPESVRRA